MEKHVYHKGLKKERCPSLKKLKEFREVDDTIFTVKIVYLIGILIWVFLIFWLSLYKTQGFGFVFLLIPIVLFIQAFSNAHVVCEEVESSVFRTNYSGVGLLFLVPLLGFVSKGYCGDRDWYITILMTSIIFILFSLVDVWVEKKWIRVYRHTKSVFQTIALFLIIFSVYGFYLSCPHHLNGLFS